MGKYMNVVSYNPTSMIFAINQDKYVIVGRCLSGSRHYSEPLTWDEVEKEFDKYVAVVDYFGGGIVEIYNGEGEICRSKVVVDFDF